MLRQLGWLLVLALIPALVSGAVQLQWRETPPAKEGEVSASTVKAWGESVLFVDARPRSRFDAGHLPGAVLLNEDEWDVLVPHFLDQWEPGKRVVVYCDGGTCDASHAVAGRLKRDLQIEDVHVLEGGWAKWQ